MDIAPAAKTVDDIYYEVAKPGSLSERVMIMARDAIYETFMRRHPLRAADSIVDVGVSDVITNGDNMIERKYPHPSAITAAGLGDGHQFRSTFPEINYVRVEPGAPLPFADRQFRIAVSNAVLEHVGSLAAQQAFTEELVRVADEVFLTVPNRYFFVEHHTLFPFIHWMDWSFGLACRALGKAKWSRRETLILMSAARLRQIALNLSVPADWTVGTTGLAFGPCSSNLFLSIKRKPAA
jgi:hypothetical protein